jgi:hypothetical protein
MSILDTKHDDAALVDFTFDHELAVGAATLAAAIAQEHRPASEGGRVAHFFTAMRQRSLIKNGASLFAEPALYEEYRASLARRDAAKDESLRG